MIKKKKLLLSIPLLMVIMILACKKGLVEPSGRLATATDCKTFQVPTSQSGFDLQSADYTSTEDCIEYYYNAQNKTLILKHINAGFNCCPGKISADIIIEGHTLVIKEKEETAGCSCLCLFDLDYEIMDLEPGVYQLRIVEPYVDSGQDPLEFSVNLEVSCEGKHCLQRTFYPWGLE